MQHFIEFVLTHLVKNPSELSVEREERPNQVFYRVLAHPDDIGRIIGSRGRTIKAVQKVVSILAESLGEKFQIEIVKENDYPHPDEAEYDRALENSLDI